jgi:hypothetical protein
MNHTLTLSAAELLALFRTAKGNPDGTITISFSTDVPTTVTSAKDTAVVSPTGGTTTLSAPGHTVTENPPLSATGQATMFGLNWDGTIDQYDNGIGFFADPKTGMPYVTRSTTLVGVSLPREVMLSTFLNIDVWQVKGIDRVWAAEAGEVQAYVTNNAPLITLDSGGLTVTDAPLVDAGPSAGTHNAIDLTYFVAHALNTQGAALATYRIDVAGKPLTIRGWDFETQRVLGS